MRLKSLLLGSALALSFVVSSPTDAKADPVSAAIVAFAGFTGTAAAVATFVVNTALYAAGSWAVGKVAQKLGLMKSAVGERQAVVTTLSLGEVGREAVVGLACVGGSLADGWNNGGKYGTDYATRRIILADHLLDALVGYYVDEVYYPFAANGVQPGFNGALQLTFHNATVNGLPPPVYMLNAGVGLTSADRNPSTAEIWVTTRYDDQVWTRGHPVFKFVVRGLRCYDPRYDVRFGYAGPNPQTWEDVSTHRFSLNAAVVRYNVQRGVYATGRHGQIQHLLIGRGLTEDEAPPQRTIAAANLCDELIDGKPRYAVAGVISSLQPHVEVEEMFAAAMAGQIVQRDGGVEVEPGQAKAAVVTITDADLADGYPVEFASFLPDTDGGRINTVVSRYVEPQQLWKDHSGAVLRDQADIVEDGGPREMTLPLVLVTDRDQADRNGEIARRSARLEHRATLTLAPYLNAGRAAAEIEDGDWIDWQSDRYLDGATMRFRVDVYGVDEGWRNTLQLTQTASSVFGQPDPIEDRSSPPPAPTPADALYLLGVEAEAIALAGETSIKPAIRFTWDVTTQDTAITAIRAEVRKLNATEISPTRFDDPAAGVNIAESGVFPEALMECRLVPIGDPTRPVLASNWITVSTGGLVAGVSPDDPTIQSIDAELAALFGAQLDLSGDLADARATLEAQAGLIGDNATAISGVLARTTQTEADVIDLELAQTAETSARAAAIQRVEAASQGGSLDGNPTFAAFADPAMPDVWTAWGRQDNARVAGRFSAWALRQHDNTGGVVANTGIVQTGNTHPGLLNAAAGYYVLEADVRLDAGGLRGAGLLLYAGDSYGDGDILTLNFGVEPDINGLVAAGPAPMSRSFRKLVRLNNPANGVLTFHAMTHWDGFAGPRDPKYLTWDRAVVRPATLEEVAAGTVLPNLQAQVTTQALAIVDLELQASVAWYEVVAAGSGGEPSLLRLVAPDGYAALVAPKVVLGSMSGGTIIEVLSIYGTKARFSGDVEIDGDLVIDGTVNGRDKLERDTVTPMVASYTAGAVTLNGTQTTTVAEIIVTSVGAPLVVEFTGLVFMTHEPAGSFDLTIELRRGPSFGGAGDIQVLSETVSGAGNTADNVVGKWPMKVKVTPPAGTWRYYVIARVTASNMTVAQVLNRFMSVLELRSNN